MCSNFFLRFQVSVLSSPESGFHSAYQCLFISIEVSIFDDVFAKLYCYTMHRAFGRANVTSSNKIRGRGRLFKCPYNTTCIVYRRGSVEANGLVCVRDPIVFADEYIVYRRPRRSSDRISSSITIAHSFLVCRVCIRESNVIHAERNQLSGANAKRPGYCLTPYSIG